MSKATLDEVIADAAAAASKDKPVKTFRHQSITASVFENQGKNGQFYSVSLQRAFKDGDVFKHTSSFTRDDIPVAAYLLDRAYSFVLESEAQQKPDQ